MVFCGKIAIINEQITVTGKRNKGDHMKDKVFIVWSGDSSVAQKVKNRLEGNHNYICLIGGGFGTQVQAMSVGDTVIKQMNLCNQAIVLFQNRQTGTVSDNLFFELGYVAASYGWKKIHCISRKGESILLPSDFDNSFVEAIEGKTDDEFADNIVAFFLKRQRLSLVVNKMQLINNRHIMHDIIQAHYSEMGSKCSDYELAQYILFYMQAAVMFQDEPKVLEELRDFKRKHNMEFSKEITIAVNLSVALLEVQVGLKNDGGTVFLDEPAFRKYYNACRNILDEIEEDASGTFDEWAKTFASENIAYACCHYAENPGISDSMRTSLYERTIKYGKEALVHIEQLEANTPTNENNDSTGLISLFKAYVYRHLFLACRSICREEAGEWLNKALKERAQLVRNYNDYAVDSKLYMNFEMEYYLILIEYLNYYGRDGMDPFDFEMSLSEIDEFIAKTERNNSVHVFMKAISEQRKSFE